MGALSAYDDDNGNVTLWDAASEKFLRLRGDGRAIERPRLTFSPDGRTLATTSDDGTVKLWNTATGNEVRALRGHATHLAYSPDGRTIALVSSGRNLMLWDPATANGVRAKGATSAWIYGLVFSPNGHTVASTGKDYAVQLWDAATDKPVRVLRGPAGQFAADAYEARRSVPTAVPSPPAARTLRCSSGRLPLAKNSELSAGTRE